MNFSQQLQSVQLHLLEILNRHKLEISKHGARIEKLEKQIADLERAFFEAQRGAK